VSGLQPAGVVAVGDKVSVLRLRTDSWAPSVTSKLVGPDSSSGKQTRHTRCERALATAFGKGQSFATRSRILL